MVEEVEEKNSEALNLRQYWPLVRRRQWYFVIPLFRWMAGGLVSKLDAALDLSVWHPDSSGTADHAKRLRRAQHKRQSAATLAEHYAADP